jgi:hypothetical protein
MTWFQFYIDKTPPLLTILPYNLDQTSESITVFASVEGGTLNADSYTFTENGSFTFIATDQAGNVSEKTVTITNIIKKVNLDSELVGQGGDIQLSIDNTVLLDQQVFIGKDVKVEAQIKSGYRVYQWIVNGVIQSHKNGSFLIENIQKDTIISCRVCNDWGFK